MKLYFDETTPVRLASSILGALRGTRKGHPIQGLLIGSIDTEPASGTIVTLREFVPFEAVKQGKRTTSSLATLMGSSMGAGSSRTLLGWALVVDRDCNLLKVASVYAEAFAREYIRLALANIGHSTHRSIPTDELLQEIAAFLALTVGLVVVRELAADGNACPMLLSPPNARSNVLGDATTVEYCAYRGRIHKERLQSFLNEPAILDVDLLEEAPDLRLLSHYADLDPISFKAIEILLEQLRADQLECNGSDAPTTGAGHGQGISRPTMPTSSLLGRRTTSRRRRKSAGETVSETAGLGSLPSKDFATSIALPKKRSFQLLETFSICPVEITCLSTSYPPATVHPPLSSPAIIAQTIAELEGLSDKLLQDELALLSDYRSSCQEYELLTFLYQILSQPDELLLRKLNSLEEYEERMKKLGARLKQSLSPEDLLKTLAALQQQ